MVPVYQEGEWDWQKPLRLRSGFFLDGQLSATFTAASLKDSLTRLRGRAHKKSVRSGALSLTWLIGSFRHTVFV